MKSILIICFLFLSSGGLLAERAPNGEARLRWECMNQIHLDKFDLILPEAMRENGVDMWITVNRESADGRSFKVKP